MWKKYLKNEKSAEENLIYSNRITQNGIRSFALTQPQPFSTALFLRVHLSLVHGGVGRVTEPVGDSSIPKQGVVAWRDN